MMMVMLMMHHDHDEDDDDDDDGDGDDDGKKVGSKPPACLRSVHNDIISRIVILLPNIIYSTV